MSKVMETQIQQVCQQYGTTNRETAKNAYQVARYRGHQAQSGVARDGSGCYAVRVWCSQDTMALIVSGAERIMPAAEVSRRIELPSNPMHFRINEGTGINV